MFANEIMQSLTFPYPIYWYAFWVYIRLEFHHSVLMILLIFQEDSFISIKNPHIIISFTSFLIIAEQ